MPLIARVSGSSEAPRPTVLVAASEAELRDVLERLLREAAYHTCHAADGIAAVRAILARAPRVVILDLHLAPVDGLFALELIRAVGSELPVILIAATTDPALARSAKRLGVTALLPKPFRNADLLDAVARAVAEPAAHRSPSEANRS